MTLMRYRPLVSRMMGQWPDLWDEDFFSGAANQRGIEVYETKNSVVVKANVAGVPEDKIELTFEKGVLFVSAQAEEEQKDEEKKHYSHSSWSYSYKVYVPGDIDMARDPKAEVEKGVLTVTFDKLAEVQPRKLAVTKKA